MKPVISFIVVLSFYPALAFGQNETLLLTTSSSLGFQNPGSGSTVGQLYFSASPNNRTLQVIPARTVDGDIINGFIFDASYTNTGGNNGFLFRTGSNNRLVISENGKVGIGTATPRALLEVHGDFWVGTTEGGSGISDQTRFSGASGLFMGDAGSILDNNNQGLNLISRTNLRFFVDELSGNAIEAMYIKNNGNVGIGTTNPSQKLTVTGTIKSKEVIVTEDTGADFVFKEDYPLPSLEELERIIQQEHHLPGIPSAEQMKREGVRIGNLQMKLLEKIEELTLHVINQNKLMHWQRKKIETLETGQQRLKTVVQRLQKRLDKIRTEQ